MKKIITLISTAVLFSATTFAAGEMTMSEPKEDKRPVSMREFFTEFCEEVGYGVPEVSLQIDLRIPGVERQDVLYSALQKCVYLGFIPNSRVNYRWDATITPKFINIFVSKYLHIDPDVNEDENVVTRTQLRNMMRSIPNYKMLMSLGEVSSWGSNGNYASPLIRADGFAILSQVYLLLKTEYRDSDKVSDKSLLEGAIKGMADAVGDVNTQYFPPAEAEQFNDQLNGSFEGIGAYLELIRPGEVMITSVIKDSPAQKAGLLPNDRITKVDEYEIAENDSLQAIIAKIKGPAGTTVELTIRRNGAVRVIPVKRAEIIIDMIEYELRNNIPVISIYSFGWGVATEWNKIIESNKSAIQRAGKIIIDLRNNPGGSLGDVAQMLGDFVPAGEPVVYTTTRYYDEAIASDGRDTIDFSKIKIVILINEATASASEIMAGTIKDYMPNNTTLIGQTSFGKGSVQYLQPLADNSSFKVTIAHWYTGKTRQAIDGVGIKPDIAVELDHEQLKQGYDTQMAAAMRQ